MSIIERLEQALSSPPERPEIATEEDWLALWRSHDLGGLPPEEMAFAGGLLADRPAWCFIAGYQAAQRLIFPELPAASWSAFAASESRDDRERFPGTVLDETADGIRLSGCKGWIACSRTVSHLLVTVNGPEPRTARTVLIAAGETGVTLAHREAPGFLGVMSQGRARFEDVPVAATRLFGPDRARQFARSEPRLVMLAGAAFLLGGPAGDGGTASADRLAALVLALADLGRDRDARPQILAALDAELQALVREADRAGLADARADWPADRPLLSLYSRRIRHRAGREDPPA